MHEQNAAPLEAAELGRQVAHDRLLVALDLPVLRVEVPADVGQPARVQRRLQAVAERAVRRAKEKRTHAGRLGDELGVGVDLLGLLGRVLAEVVVAHRVVGDQVPVRRDLADQIAARDVLRPLPLEPPAGDEEDCLQPAAVELVEDERRAAQVGAVIERQQQLARLGRGVERDVRAVPRRRDGRAALRAEARSRRSRTARQPPPRDLARRIRGASLPPTSAGTKSGARSAAAATSRRATSMTILSELSALR